MGKDDNFSELLALPEYSWVKEDLLPAYYVLSKMKSGIGNGYLFLPTSEENLLITLRKRALSELREVEQIFAAWIGRERVAAVYQPSFSSRVYSHGHHSGDAHEIRINITSPLLNIGKEQFKLFKRDLGFDFEIETIYDLFFFKYLLSNTNVSELKDTGFFMVVTKDGMWESYNDDAKRSAKTLVRKFISCNITFLSDAILETITGKLMGDREIFYEFMDSIPERYKAVEHDFNVSSCYLHYKYAIPSEVWSGIRAKIEDIDYISIIKPSLSKLEEEYSAILNEIKFLELLKQNRVDANNPMKIGDYKRFSDVIERLDMEGFIKISPIEDITISEEGRETIINRINSLGSEVTEIILRWLNEPVKHEDHPPKLKVSPNSSAFEDVKQGDTPSKTFTVENVGGGTLEWEVRNVPDWLDVSTTSGTNDGSFTVTLKSDASVGDYDGTVEVISNDGSESIDVSGHIGERGGGTFPPPPNGSILLVGYECGTGSPVNIKPAHLFISGLTQKAGKTTTLEALVLRSGLKTISFITKPNEKCFDTGECHLPFFQEKAEWRVIEKLFEAQLGEKMKDIRAKLIELCKHEKTLGSIKDKIDEALDSSKGSERKSLVLLQAYFEELFNALAGKEYTNTLDLKRGINLMDLTGYNEELQSYIINSVLDEILKNQKNTVVIIPEAWKFIPQSKSSACKYSIDQLIRQGAVNNNFVWFDSQDIAGVDKSMLKSVSIWILGLQTEINEVQHTINQIPLPKNQKPTEDQIMNLDVGVFFVCADGIAKKTYVMPKWKSEEEAKEIAISMEQFKK